jgi:hypothetical protein
MDSPDVERIVPAEPVLQRHGVEADHSGDDPDERSGGGRDIAGSRSDRGQTRDGAGQQAEELGLLGREPVDGEPGDGGKARRDVGIQEGDGGDRIDAELTAGVESVPSEPEQSGAQGDERNGVRSAVRDFALADVEDRGERRDAGDVVDNDAAGEVEDAPELRMPPPQTM